MVELVYTYVRGAYAARLVGSNPTIRTNGRLAQLVEHILDVNGVIGSSPIPPTKIKLSEMKIEILEDKKESKTPKETEQQQFNSPRDQLEFEIQENEFILKLSNDIEQGVAILDFEKDENGEIKTLTVTEARGGSKVFEANNKTWTGRRAIENIISLLGKSKKIQ